MKGFPILLTLAVTAAAHAGARPQPVRRNACEILTRTEVAAVQGEPFTESKLTDRGATSQCFYQLPSFMKSVSVDLTRGGGRAFWREHFSAGRDEESREKRSEAEREHGGPEAKSSGEEEETSPPPKAVRGVGDAAFWAGSRAAGSLYVLKDDSILRISVGGPGSEAQKIDRSKILARKALRRI